MAKSKTRKEWQLDPGLVALNLETKLILPETAWTQYHATPMSAAARAVLHRIADKHFAAIARQGAHRQNDIIHIIEEIVTNSDWQLRAQIACALCSRYSDALAEFGKSFRLHRNHPDAKRRQFDAMRLIKTCERAREWSERSDEGLRYRRQMSNLHSTRKRLAIEKAFLKAAQIVRSHELVLAMPITEALFNARLFEASNRGPQHRLMNMLLSMLRGEEQRSPSNVGKVYNCVVAALSECGIDLENLEREHHRLFPGSASVQMPRFPGRKEASDKFARALEESPAAIERAMQLSLKEVPEKKKWQPGEAVMAVQIGNLQYLGHRAGAPANQRTQLAVALAVELAELSAHPAGRSRPVRHLFNIGKPRQNRRHAVVAAFVRDALGGTYSESAAAKAIGSLSEDKERISLGDWSP